MRKILCCGDLFHKLSRVLLDFVSHASKVITLQLSRVGTQLPISYLVSRQYPRISYGLLVRKAYQLKTFGLSDLGTVTAVIGPPLSKSKFEELQSPESDPRAQVFSFRPSHEQV